MTTQGWFWYNNMKDQENCKHKWVLVAQQMKCEYCLKVYEVK